VLLGEDIMPLRTAVRRRRSQKGFTLIEVMVATMVLGIVMSAIFSVLYSLTNSQVRSQALVDNQENVRLALVAISRDLRSASKLDPLASVTDYPNQVQFETLSGAVERWRYDTSAKALHREVQNGVSWTNSYTLTNVRNIQTGVALFRYYRDASDTEISPAVANSSDLANCTIHVHIAISSNSEPGPQPFTAESDAELRNRLPGGIPGC
jgi:prepilin-type N-terminal cleavage/methylation domain-containing protein